MKITTRNVFRLGVIGTLGGLLLGCGGGSGNGGPSSTTAPTDPRLSAVIVLPAVGGPLPAGVLAYDKIAHNVTKLHFSENMASGQAVLWETAESDGSPLPKHSLHASSYDTTHGWTNEIQIKSGLVSSDVKMSIDSLGDIHVSWFSPGHGIYAKSRINDFWQGETLLTNTGGCLDMESQSVGAGAKAIWCEAGSLIGSGKQEGTNWINQGVFLDEYGDSVSGREPSMAALNNEGIIATWSSVEIDASTGEPVGVLKVAEYSNSGVVVSNVLLDEFKAGATPVSEVFTDNIDSHIVAWVDASSSSIELKASAYNGVWSTPAALHTSAGGYTELKAKFMDNGDIVLFAQQLGGNLSVLYFNGVDWSTTATLNNVISFDSILLGDEILLVYSNSTEAKGLTIDKNEAMTEIFILGQPINNIGLSKLKEGELMTVWQKSDTAYFAILEY